MRMKALKVQSTKGVNLQQGLAVVELVIAVPLTVFVGIYARQIASIVFGEGYHEGYVVIPLVLAGLLHDGIGRRRFAERDIAQPVCRHDTDRDRDFLLLMQKWYGMGLIDNDLSHLSEYCRAVAGAVGMEIPVNYPVVGRDAFRTATGVHAAAVVKAAARGDAWLSDMVPVRLVYVAGGILYLLTAIYAASSGALRESSMKAGLGTVD